MALPAMAPFAEHEPVLGQVPAGNGLAVRQRAMVTTRFCKPSGDGLLMLHI